MRKIDAKRGSIVVSEDGEVAGTAAESQLFPGSIEIDFGTGAQGHPDPAQAYPLLRKEFGVTKAQFDLAFGHLSGAVSAAPAPSAGKKTFVTHLRTRPGGIVVQPKDKPEEFIWVMDEVVNPETGKGAVQIKASPDGKTAGIVTATTALARWKAWGGHPDTFGRAFGHLLQRERQSRIGKARARKSSRIR